jgi:hypothetical protein
MTITTTTASERLAELSIFVRSHLENFRDGGQLLDKLDDRALERVLDDLNRGSTVTVNCGEFVEVEASQFLPSRETAAGTAPHRARFLEELLGLRGASPTYMYLATAQALCLIAWAFTDRNAHAASPEVCRLQTWDWVERAPLAGWLKHEGAVEVALAALEIVKASMPSGPNAVAIREAKLAEPARIVLAILRANKEGITTRGIRRAAKSDHKHEFTSDDAVDRCLKSLRNPPRGDPMGHKFNIMGNRNRRGHVLVE